MTNILTKANEIKTIVHASLKTLVSKELRTAYTNYSKTAKKAVTERNKAIKQANKKFNKAMSKEAHKFNDKIKAIYTDKKQELVLNKIHCRKQLSQRECCGC